MAWQRKGEPRAIGGAAIHDTERALPRAYRKAAKRARVMGLSTLLEYADVALVQIGREIVEHQRMPGAGDHLREAEQQAATLWALLAEATTRQPVPEPERLPGADAATAAFRQG